MRKDNYRRIAAVYDTIVEPINAQLRTISLAMYPPRNSMHVLEVGCGTGSNLVLYYNSGCSICGIDLSLSMLKTARKKLGMQTCLHLGNASSLPYSDCSFDIVIAMFIFHEMPQYMRLSAMNEMCRVLKIGGRIIITDFHPGPLSFPRGFLNNLFIKLCEMLAGREHFRNFRSFMLHACMAPLIGRQDLHEDKILITSGGNIGLYSMNRC